jgi:hypothetical protein
MWGIWLAVAVVFGIIWAGIALSQKVSGDKHQSAAKEAAAIGDWEQAALSYKLAILSRLDSPGKVQELVHELSDLYRSRNLDPDMSQILECPGLLKTLGAGTGNQRKKNELIAKLYTETGTFLDGLPGPELPDD